MESHELQTEQQPTTTPTPTTYPPQPSPTQDATHDHQTQTDNLELDGTTNDGVTPAMALRLGLLRRILLSLSETTGARRRSLVWTTLSSVGQIIAFSVLIGLSRSRPCDQPLRAYLIMTIVRLAVCLPLSFYTALAPPRPSRTDSPEHRQEVEQARRVGSALTDHRINRLVELCNLAALVFFVLGNFWFISSKTCRATNPETYWASLTALVISWLYLAEILFIVIAVIFFLPIFFIGMRLFGWGEAKNEIGPLSKTDIHKLPLRVYLGPKKEEESVNATADGNGTTSNATATPTTPSKGRSFWRLWKNRDRVRRGKGGAGKSGVDNGAGEFVAPPPGTSWIELPDNLSSCAICLCDYELPPRVGDENVAEWLKEDPLRLLPCGHCFHSECAESWLVVSGRCPVCQRPVKGDGKKNKRKGSNATPGTGNENNV